MKITPIFSIAFAVMASVATESNAQVISQGTQTIVSEGGVAPGSEYLFIAGPSNLTNFSVDTSLLTIYPGSQNPSLFSMLTPPGKNPVTDSFLTGFGYFTLTGSVSNQTLVTFTANAVSFSLFVLDSNVIDSGSVNSSFILTSGTGSATYATPQHPGTAVNQFTEFVVTGVTPGSVFTLGGSASTNTNLYIGGLTFGNVVPVPEPSTWALVAGSLLMVCVFGRARFRSA